MGSHLDSVPAGPGINDNGWVWLRGDHFCMLHIHRSGSAANLEIALALSRLGIEPKNKVQFYYNYSSCGLVITSRLYLLSGEPRR